MSSEYTNSILHIGEMTIRVVVADDLIQSFEASMPRSGLGPGLHLHTGMDEIFYVTSGKVRITSGDLVVMASPGDVVRVPKMTPHQWQSVDGPAQMLFTFIPGQNQVGYLRELAELSNSGKSWNEGIAALQTKYDNRPL
jgi:mannose-6-phosphate isomerase-like protein (cupin superfamily)